MARHLNLVVHDAREFLAVERSSAHLKREVYAHGTTDKITSV